MRNIIFLFGAGASYGAGGILPESPPLGSGLYPELARLYPRSWGSLPHDVVQAFTNHFEEGMGLVHSRFGEAVPNLMREMAIFFAQFRAVNDSCYYTKLVHDLATEGLLAKTCFSSLNYDCVLDFAIASAGFQLNYFECADTDRIPLWKLHGSCNMFSKDVQVSPDVLYGTGVTFEGGIQAFLDPNRIIEHCLSGTALAPVMSLYMKGKPLNISPLAVSAVLALWTQRIITADLVVIAGVRPWQEDSHIWGPLAETVAPLLFIGNAPEIDTWAASSRTGITEVIGARVNDCYNSMLRRVRHYVFD